MLVSLENVSKVFAERAIFLRATVKIEEGDRIGLVGANGAGKTTLLGVLAGESGYEDGERAAKTGLTLGYLRQNSGVDGANTILEEMRREFGALLQIQKEIRTASARMASFTDHSDPEFLALEGEYAKKETFFASAGGYDIDVKIETVLNGMGFRGTDRQTSCSTLSGGEKTRLALAKLLLRDPELLMLDEPTNHLDFETLEWLESYLNSYKGALVVVSHDRYFLDRICTKIWEVSNIQVQTYKGNYTKYIQTREMIYERQRKEYDMQQKNVAKLTDYIARNKARATTAAMAKSREKELDRMELVKAPPKPVIPARISFRYEVEPVKDVLHIEGMTLHVGKDKLLCREVDFDLMRGEKVALVGKNGIGKTSFLKAILGKLDPDAGRIRWGRNVKTAYYEQETLDLNPRKTVLQELWDRYPQTYEQDVRNVLGCLRFTGEDVYKTVEQLSGGEKARLKFAIMTYQEGNVLVLDEPTNHLDLMTKEALDRALIDYTGTILTISHDRYLLNRMPTRIVEMGEGGFFSYQGGYEQYAAARARRLSEQRSAQPQKGDPRDTKESPAERTDNASPSEQDSASTYYRSKKQRAEEAAKRKRFHEVEQEIADLEMLIAEMQERLNDPEKNRDYQALREDYEKLDEKRTLLSSRMEEWAELAEHME